MKFYEFKLIFSEILERTHLSEEYLRSIPTDIQKAFCENEYVNQLGIINDVLLQCVFGDLSGEVYFFLYDWKEGFKIEVDDKEYIINCLDDFFQYIHEIYFPNDFEEPPEEDMEERTT